MSETNYAVAPGEYLQEWMDEYGCTREQAAEQMSVYVHEVDRIVAGTEQVTDLVAVRLEYLTGIPRSIWERQEAQYRADLKRLAAVEVQS